MKVKKITPNLFLRVVKEIDGICFCKEYKSSQFYLNEFTSMNTHLTVYESSYINSFEDYEIEFESIPERSKRKNDESIKNIIKIVSDITDVDIDSIMSKKQQAYICDARHLAIYFIREFTDLSLHEIADIFGRDHSTIFNSIRKVESLNNYYNKEFKRVFDRIKVEIIK